MPAVALQLRPSSRPVRRPDIGDLIPWALNAPKLHERDIAGLTADECRHWLQVLGGERASIEGALAEHARRCRLVGTKEDATWVGKVRTIKATCEALIHQVTLQLEQIQCDERTSFQELFIQSAYAILSPEDLEAVLMRVDEMRSLAGKSVSRGAFLGA